MGRRTRKGGIKIRHILLVLLLLGIIGISAAAISRCSEDKGDTSQTTATTKKPTIKPTPDPSGGDVEYEVAGKEYVADLSTLQCLPDEDNEASKIQIETFKNTVKIYFKDSKITFTGENSFTMSGTNNGNNDFVAENCERKDNELFKAIEGKGNVDLLIYEDKVSFMCDFFDGYQILIDYKLVKNEADKPTEPEPSNGESESSGKEDETGDPVDEN